MRPPRLKPPQIAELADLAALLGSGLIKRWGVAVDGGAHVGGWTVALAERFDQVVAFEPGPTAFAALKVNTAGLANVKLRPEALMDRGGRIDSYAPDKIETLSARRVAFSKDGAGKAIKLDHLRLPMLDFLKLDVEGAEVLALLGGKKTIRRCRPFIVVEEAGLGHVFDFPPDAATRLLVAWDYAQVWTAGVNRGFAP